MAKFLVISEYQDPPSRPSYNTRTEFHIAYFLTHNQPSIHMPYCFLG